MSLTCLNSKHGNAVCSPAGTPCRHCIDHERALAPTLSAFRPNMDPSECPPHAPNPCSIGLCATNRWNTTPNTPGVSSEPQRLRPRIVLWVPRCNPVVHAIHVVLVGHIARLADSNALILHAHTHTHVLGIAPHEALCPLRVSANGSNRACKCGPLK